MPAQSIRQALGASGHALRREADAAAATTAAAAGRRAAFVCRQARLLSSLSATARPPTMPTTATRASAAATASYPLLRASAFPAAASWRQQQPRARLLSTTAPCSGQAITFSPTSSPELDALLDRIRSTIILPSYLSSEQQRQLYDRRYKEKLQASPITLDMDGTIHRYTYMDILYDLPNTRAAVREAVGRMATRDDFANLPRLLEGLHRAGRRLRPDDYARIARRAGERGCIYVVIECARTVRRTGFCLENAEIVSEILTHVQLKAVDSAWDEAATCQALVWAELVVDLLEDENHGRHPVRRTAAADTWPPPPAFPLARDPQVLAARLHLAAAVAEKFPAAVDDAEAAAAAAAAVEKVYRYSAQLVQLWPAGRGLRQLHDEATYADRHGELFFMHNANKFLGLAAVLLHGLQTAVRVLEPVDVALASEVMVRRDAVATEVQTALAAAPGQRGADIYKKVYGEAQA